MATTQEMVKYLHKHQGLSLAMIAGKCHCTESCVSRWLSGDRKNPIQSLRRNLTYVYNGYKAIHAPRFAEGETSQITRVNGREEK